MQDFEKGGAPRPAGWLSKNSVINISMKMTKVLSQLENGVPFSKTGFFSPNDSVHSELYIFAPIQIQNIEYGINIKYKNKTETDSWLIDWSIGSTVNLSTTKKPQYFFT